jgi:hypothetical protein
MAEASTGERRECDDHDKGFVKDGEQRAYGVSFYLFTTPTPR